MTVKISQTADVQRFFEEASGQLNERGDPRTKKGRCTSPARR